MKIIDLPSDRGFVHFNRIKRSLPELPVFVKQAAINECTETSSLDASAYADVINKKFPLHTKAAAFLSYAFFKDQEHKFTKEAAARINRKFESAANVWGIRTEMRQLDKAIEPQAEKQAGAEAYALNAAGSFFFPIDTPTHVVKSAQELVKYRNGFTYAMRKEAATGIMKAAVAHGLKTINLPEEVHYMAGFGLCDKEAAVKELQRRELYAAGARSPIKHQMNKLASQISATDDLSQELMTKVAEIVDVVDRELQITKSYGTTFAYPEDVFFGAFTEKTAAHIKASTVSMITGNAYSLDQLSKAADALKVFGDDFYSEVVRKDGSVDLQKVADVLPTMPRDEAALFDRAMNSAMEKNAVKGLNPLDRLLPASVRMGFLKRMNKLKEMSPEELSELGKIFGLSKQHLATMSTKTKELV